MRRWQRMLSITAALIALVACGMVGLAMASSVHWKQQRDPIFTDLGVTLNATGALAGLGNLDVVILMTATADTATTCTNQGGNPAPGQNPGDITVSGTQTIPASKIKNGNVDFSVTTVPPDPPTWDEAGCANSNWVAAFTDLDFTSATITVMQGGVVVLTETFGL